LVPLSFAVCVSDDAILQANLLASPCLGRGSPHEVILIRGAPGAASGLNQAIERAKHELVVCVHQDVYLPRGWERRVYQQFRLAEERFGPIGVAGVYGVGEVEDRAGAPPAARRVGWIYDRDRLLRDGPELPARASTLDEVVLILRRDMPLWFDPALGFHLYGADLCLRARERGPAVVVLEALCLHNSRSVGLPEAFFPSARAFARKWRHRLPVATSCVVFDGQGRMFVLGDAEPSELGMSRAVAEALEAPTPSPRPSPRRGEGDPLVLRRASSAQERRSPSPSTHRGEGARRADEGAEPGSASPSPHPSPRWGEGDGSSVPRQQSHAAGGIAVPSSAAERPAEGPVRRSGHDRRLASIIVPCWNQVEFTRHCLRALFQHTRRPWELIVVDNGSTDGTGDYLAAVRDAAPGPVTVISNVENLGFPRAVNQGSREARGDVMVLLNNDAVVTDGWLDQLIALSSMRREDGPGARAAIGLVGPMSNYAAPPQLVEAVPYRDLDEMHAFARRWRDEHRGRWFAAAKLSGFCLLMTRAVYEAIGGLDERFGLGLFDDDDLAVRARRAGFELAVAHDLFVHHFGSRTFVGNGIDARRLLEENAGRFAAKWGQEVARGRRVALRPWGAPSRAVGDDSGFNIPDSSYAVPGKTYRGQAT
jgi:GT2 family glycosyltransferase